ncbi:hypothetical protein KAI87_05070, partial [Myxococcota bacterium]|nr:hypothetical protein [Myxococcota bacterium]
MKSLKRLLPYLRPETGALGIAYFFMVILAITNAFYAFLAGPALKFVFTGNVRDVIRQSSGELRSFWEFFPPEALKQLEALDDNAALFLVPALIVITAVIKGVAQTGQFYFMGQTSQRALRRIRQKAFDALIRQSPSFFHHRSHGDLLSRLTNDANLIEQGLFYGFGAMVREPLSIIALLFFCFYTDSTLALVTFITVPVAVLPLLRFTKWLKKVSRRGQNAQG